VLKLCRQARLVNLGPVAIDGTKINANASKHKAMSYWRMKQAEGALRQEVAELLRRAEAADRDEDAQHGAAASGDELPAELARRDSRLRTIAETKAALAVEARAAAAAQGKDPTDSPPPDGGQRNFTDPESKIPKTSEGFIQGYGAHLTVDEYAQVIVAPHVTAAAQHVRELPAAVPAMTRVLRRKPEAILADAVKRGVSRGAAGRRARAPRWPAARCGTWCPARRP
jgi:hypothetical protein